MIASNTPVNNNNNDIELLRLQISQEVFKKFDELGNKINKEGCDFGRVYAQRVKDFIDMEYENLKSDLMSKYGSINSAQKLLFEDILPKFKESSIEMANKAAICENAVLSQAKLIKGAAVTFGIGVVMMLITGIFSIYQEWITQNKSADILNHLSDYLTIESIQK